MWGEPDGWGWGWIGLGIFHMGLFWILCAGAVWVRSVHARR